MGGDRIRAALLVVALAAGLACAGTGAWMIARDSADTTEYEKLAEQYGPASGQEEQDDEDEGEGIDWDALRGINASVCGWVSVDGTSISLPVVRADKDNPDKYLSYSLSGERSDMGCPYLNYACDPNGRALVVYGHHVWYETRMFNELGDAYKASRFSMLGGAWWTTPELGGKRFRLVGSALIEKTEGDEWNRTSFSSAADARSWLSAVLPDLDQRSGEADELASTATRVLILATCSDTGNRSKRCVTIFADPDPQFDDTAA